VLLLPEPVTPVTSTMPRSACAMPAARRQAQRLEVRDLDRDHAHHDHQRAALPQDVHAEPADARRTPRAVVVVHLVETLAVARVRDQLRADLLDLLRRQPLLRERHQLAVMRARMKSPALMWMSDAPRWIAALKISIMWEQPGGAGCACAAGRAER
jgi:hypothetical protein